MRKQLIDLEGADQAEPHPLLGRQRRDVVVAEEDAAAVRLQHPGHQVDQRGLAGAVGTDQRVAHAVRQDELDIGGDDQRAETLVQAVRGQRVRAHDTTFMRRARSVRPPRMPFGSSMTTAIRSRPIQKYQYCGLIPENWSRATM